MKFDPDALKQARLNKGYSYKALAMKSDVTDRGLAHWEAGRREPQVNKLASVAEALDVTIMELMR